MNQYTEFTTKQIDAAYINTLVDFISACRDNDVKIDTVKHFQNGWHITFVGCPHADAICHDGSYGSPNPFPHPKENDWDLSGKWETIGFPWDGDDVSVHSSEELAQMIADYQRGEYREEEWD